MEQLKVLLVEDNQTDIEACHSTIKRYQLEKKIKIECVTATSKEQAFQLINSTFDGAIIDIKLDREGTEGNDIINQIHNENRIPIAVLTGTPENVTQELEYLGCFKKGETGYEEIFDQIYQVYLTGLTKILGGRGMIEDAMGRIFWNHLLPQLDSWKIYRNNGVNTERGILRTVLNHLFDLLDDDENPSTPEEMYIIPPVSGAIKTGSILHKIDDGCRYIVLSPACDLVIRKSGSCKADKVLISQIEDFDTVKSEVLNGISKQDKKIKKLSELLKNNHTDFYHWLPKTKLFNSGFINFRWTTSISISDLNDNFTRPSAQLSAPFIKDVISRFSSFYARQGQPDFDFNAIATAILQ